MKELAMGHETLSEVDIPESEKRKMRAFAKTSVLRRAALMIMAALLAMPPLQGVADEAVPWGRATAIDITYQPQKVVYDVSASSERGFSSVLSRASYLNSVYHADPFGTSIVLVLHGDEIPFFAVKNYAKYRDLVQRAQSLTVGGTVKFRVCRAAAEGHGLQPADLHGFVEVVPMADAEIIRLQQEEGYAYMR
jgi:uncharacterized protein